MKQENHFDSFVKEKIGEWESPVPDRVWDAILNSQEKKKRAAFWWRIRTAMLFAFGIAIFMIAYHIFNRTTTSNRISAETENSVIPENEHQQNDDFHFNEEKNSSPKANSSQKKASGLKTTESKAVEEHQFLLNANSELIKREKENMILGDDMSKATNKKKYRFSSSMRSKHKKGETEEMSNGETESKIKTLLDEESEGMEMENESNWLTRKVEFVSGLQKNKKPEFSRLMLSQLLILKKKEPIPCPDADVKSKKSHLEVYGGNDFVLRKFSDTPNSMYMVKRKETQTIQSAFQIGIRYNKPIVGGLSVSGGVQYNQVNEQFRHTQGNIISYTYVIDASGDTLQTIQTISARYKQISNRYRMLELPLMLGYELNLDRLSLRINAGVQFNLVSSYKGEVLDDQLVPVSISRNGPVSKFQLNRSLGISYVGSVGIYYGLPGNKKVFVEPHFQYRTKPVTNDQLSLKQKDNLWGIRVGLRFPLRG